MGLTGRSALVAAISALAFVFAPVAAADPNSPSYLQGKQAITEQIQHFHVQLNANTDWNTYCEQVLESDLKRGAILQVDSTPDFIAGCTDGGRALIAAH
ncbi:MULTISPECIES: hypothetical protein [Mycobacterium]|uniref:hypothetical protein n=1 Tax=Mycobacterium TaxID=1763 RepID=UPI001E57C9FE|nr:MULTISPECIES: hypothetical protein [Mycobacterium]